MIKIKNLETFNHGNGIRFDVNGCRFVVKANSIGITVHVPDFEPILKPTDSGGIVIATERALMDKFEEIKKIKEREAQNA